MDAIVAESKSDSPTNIPNVRARTPSPKPVATILSLGEFLKNHKSELNTSRFSLPGARSKTPEPEPSILKIGDQMIRGITIGTQKAIDIMSHESRPAHPLINDAAESLITLYTATNGKDRSHLITAITNAIKALKTIEINEALYSFIFHLSDSNPIQDEIPQLIKTIQTNITLLSRYLNHLIGEPGYQCTRADIKSLRETVKQSLLTEHELYSLFLQEKDPEMNQGLLAIFIRFKKSQQGKLNAACLRLLETAYRSGYKKVEECL